MRNQACRSLDTGPSLGIIQYAGHKCSLQLLCNQHIVHRFLPSDHPLYKDALEMFGVIPAPARMKLQLELFHDSASPATGLPDAIRTASSATAVLESLPVVSGPWNYLQRNNQTHSHQVMSTDRKAWGAQVGATTGSFRGITTTAPAASAPP